MLESMMKNAVKEQVELMIGSAEVAVKEVAERDELIDSIAKIIRKLHNALTAEGFTDEQSIQILSTVVGRAGGK